MMVSLVELTKLIYIYDFFVCVCVCLNGISVILKVVATLLKNSAPSTDLMEVRRLFLSDMIKLFSNSRENRR